MREKETKYRVRNKKFLDTLADNIAAKILPSYIKRLLYMSSLLSQILAEDKDYTKIIHDINSDLLISQNDDSIIIDRKFGDLVWGSGFINKILYDKVGIFSLHLMKNDEDINMHYFKDIAKAIDNDLPSWLKYSSNRDIINETSYLFHLTLNSINKQKLH